MRVLEIKCLFSFCEDILRNHQYMFSAREYWINNGRDSISRAAAMTHNIAVAKNVILFLGDGMGVSTVTAARIFKGQKKGQPGEEQELSFEKFPHIALSKVKLYHVNNGMPMLLATIHTSIRSQKMCKCLI